MPVARSPSRPARGSGSAEAWRSPSSPGAAELHIPSASATRANCSSTDLVLTEVGGTGNLLRNPGFEDWPDPAGIPPGWTHIAEYQAGPSPAPSTATGRTPHSGASAIRLANPSDDDAVHVKQILPVDGTRLAVGKTYRLEFWAKARHIARARPTGSGTASPPFLHNAFRAPDGTVAALLVNVTGQPRAGTLTWAAAETRLDLAPWEIRLVARDGRGGDGNGQRPPCGCARSLGAREMRARVWPPPRIPSHSAKDEAMSDLPDRVESRRAARGVAEFPFARAW